MEWYIRAGGLDGLDEYNCKLLNKTEEQWDAIGRKDNVFGTICLLYGIIVELMYIPCLMVITRPVYLKMSCYKIMTVLGVLDMFAIGVNSLLTGHLLLEGAVYCTEPNLIYIAGAIGLGLWCAACASCLVLVCNRLVELWKPYIMETIFGGMRTYYIMLVPIIYGSYFTMFTQPLIFTSKHAAWFFDPGMYPGREMEYINIPHTLNNMLIVVITCLLYSALCVILQNKFKAAANSGMTWNQKSIFIQSTAICMANLIAAMIYVYMQFFPTPNAFIIVGHVCWQFGHGFPAIVYLGLNRTIQREVLKMFGINPHKVFHFAKTGASQANFGSSKQSIGVDGTSKIQVTDTGSDTLH